jgi:D-serine deaminase-like pyridoxal phosphate-dependent protein
MSEAGIENLLVATNILGDRKLARLSGLLEAATMTVVADDAGLLPGLGRAAARAGRELRVLVECDTGLQRTGVASPDEAVELAATVSASESLEFAGFLTYPAPPGALEFLARAAELALERGLDVATVSAGGTPSMWSAARLRPTVTEYRVGTYAFHDRATVAAGAAQPDEVALTVCATVVSRPARDRAILDAGSKALSSDLSTEPGYGLVLEAPSSLLVRLNEEHGYVELAPGDELELGQQVHVVPNHACVVANLFERLAVVSDGVVSATWTVERRR